MNLRLWILIDTKPKITQKIPPLKNCRLCRFGKLLFIVLAIKIFLLSTPHNGLLICTRVKKRIVVQLTEITQQIYFSRFDCKFHFTSKRQWRVFNRQSGQARAIEWHEWQPQLHSLFLIAGFRGWYCLILRNKGTLVFGATTKGSWRSKHVWVFIDGHKGKQSERG